MLKKTNDVNLVGKNTDTVKINRVMKRCLVSQKMLKKLYVHIVCTCTCMHEREIWSHRHKHTRKNIAVYENMAPMKILAAKRTEVTGSWRKVHNEIGNACDIHGRQKKCIHDFGAET